MRHGTCVKAGSPPHETPAMPARVSVEKVQNGLEASQAWLAEAWEGFKESGRPDLAERAWFLIAEIESLAGEVSRAPVGMTAAG